MWPPVDPALVERRARSELAVALAIIDVDQFQRVNDTAGHLAGDELLTGPRNTRTR